MSKTPEEMAEEYADLCVSDAYYAPLKAGFLAGYKAAKDEEATKDQKIAALWTESIKKMLPSVHEVVLFPSESTRARDAKVVAKMDAAIKKAQDQVANVSKVMCNTTMEEIKAVDTGEITPITNLPTSAKWISVKDRLPDGCDPRGDCDYEIKDYPYVLAYSPLDGIHVAYYDTHRGVFETSATTSAYAEELYKVTHWQPLPAPPKEEK